MGFLNTLLFPTFLLLSSIFSLQSAGQDAGFRCTTNTTCHSLIDYQLPNTTTLASIRNLFEIKSLRSLLAANNLPITTPPNQTFNALQILKIPFPCLCRNGTGISNHRPNYIVVPNDGLYHIAAEVFSNLVKYPQIQSVNNISDPNTILVGQKLWIPLPCSCDDVDGERVVHYGHLVAAGSTVSGIAQQFNTTESRLLALNGLTSPSKLEAGAILDVPLKVCTSMVGSNSSDYPLLVPNGTYAFTAENCVRCQCNAANNWVLECQPSGIRGQTCPSTQCDLGNTTYISDCSRSSCAYVGYRNGTIYTSSSEESTCPEAKDSGARSDGKGWSWRRSFVVVVGALFMSVYL